MKIDMVQERPGLDVKPMLMMIYMAQSMTTQEEMKIIPKAMPMIV